MIKLNKLYTIKTHEPSYLLTDKFLKISHFHTKYLPVNWCCNGSKIAYTTYICTRLIHILASNRLKL